MDAGTLVEERIDSGRFLLERLATSGFDVTAAAWVKTADDEQWNLYVVSREVDARGLTQAYRAASEFLQHFSSPWASPSALRLVSPDTPVGRHLIDLQRRHEGHGMVHLQSLRLGDVAALEVDLYPPLAPPTGGQQPLTPQEVVQKVVGLMARTGSLRPSQVTLRDGTSFLGQPFGLELSGREMHVKFVVDGPEPTRVYPVEAIRAIE